MLVTQTSVISVPSSIGTILQLRETNSYQRTLYFQNLSQLTLSAQIEESVDGGSTWSLVGVAFSIEVGGVVVKNVTSTNILRVRASGGGDANDLYVGYTRMYDDGNNVWTTPVM